MNKGQHIHVARLKAENQDLKASRHEPVKAQSNLEVSLLKLRISVLEEDIKQRDQEIQRLTKKSQ